MPLRLLLSLHIAATVLAAAAHAQPGAWEPTFAVPGAYYDGRFGVPQGQVHAVAETDGLLCIAGDFSLIDFTEAEAIACWNGTKWSALDGDVQGDVADIAFGPSGSLFVGGTFTHVVQPDGTKLEVNGVAEWTGVGWQPLGGGLVYTLNEPQPGVVHALVVSPSGEVVVGGLFTSASNPDGTETETAGLARWTGTAWETLGEINAVGVRALAFDDEGHLYAGGQFFGGEALPEGTGVGIARWDGAAWAPLGRGISHVGHSVAAIAFDTNGDVYVGGRFDAVLQSNGDEVASRDVVRWNGTQWHALGGGVVASDYGVQSLAVTQEGVYVGGDFDEVIQPDGTPLASPDLARWNGTLWEAVSGFEPSSQRVRVLAVRAGGSLLVGGLFPGLVQPTGEPLPVSSLATRAVDGTWSPVSAISTRNGLNGGVTALTDDGCGALFVGGPFTATGTLPTRHLARWDGEGWHPLGGGISDPISEHLGNPLPLALAARGCDDVYVGGSFQTAHQADGTELTANGIARWNGTQWEALGGGTNGVVTALAGDGDGVYVGGAFTEVYQPDGAVVPARNIARWTGASWEALGGGLGDVPAPCFCTFAVEALVTAPDGTLYVGGYFDEAFHANGAAIPASNVVRWTGGDWTPLGGGVQSDLHPWVSSLALATDGTLYTGGLFQSAVQADGTAVAAHNLARWTGGAWESLGEGPGGFVAALAADGDVVYAGGPAWSIGGVARWDGSTWEELGSGLIGGTVSTLHLRDDDHLVTGGSFAGTPDLASPFLIVWNPTASTPAEEAAGLATTVLAPNYPNPFADRTTIRFVLGRAGAVALRIFDVLGRQVAVLADGPHAAGTHEAVFEAAGLRSGIYFVRLEAEGHRETRRMLLVR